MDAGHDHGGGEIRHEKPLWWALGLTASFLLVEVIGGLVPDPGILRMHLARLFEARFGIGHATLQMEASPCGPGCEEPQHR